MAASYITRHHSDGWLYQFHVPKALRELLWGAGTKRAAYRRYIKAMPKREAEALAREWAVDVLQNQNTVVGYNKSAPPNDLGVWGHKLKIGMGHEAQRTPICWRSLQAEAISHHTKLELEKQKAMPPPLSWDALFNEWVRIREAKVTRGHVATIRLLKEHFGETDCRQIRKADIGQFRDKLEANGVPYTMLKERLGHISAMFKAAANEPTSPFAGMDNPAVKMLGKRPSRKKRGAFTREQVRLILET